MEWKFSRSTLYLEYIREGATLCVPFNLVPTWKSVWYILRAIGRILCPNSCRDPKQSNHHKKKRKEKKEGNGGLKTYSSAPDVSDLIPFHQSKPIIIISFQIFPNHKNVLTDRRAETLTAMSQSMSSTASEEEPDPYEVILYR